MRTVENSTDIIERHPHSRSFSFTQFSTQRRKQAFNISPQNIRTFWLFEQQFQNKTLFLIHGF